MGSESDSDDSGSDEHSVDDDADIWDDVRVRGAFDEANCIVLSTLPS